MLEHHVVGVFCESGTLRLDLSAASVTKQRDVHCDTWSTRLHIKPLANERIRDPPRPLRYGEHVGVFSDV